MKEYVPMVTDSPIIQREKPDDKACTKGQYLTMKLRSLLLDEKSHTFYVMIPLFWSGTCKQKLDFIEQGPRCLFGEDRTTGKQSFAFMCFL